MLIIRLAEAVHGEMETDNKEYKKKNQVWKDYCSKSDIDIGNSEFSDHYNAKNYWW